MIGDDELLVLSKHELAGRAACDIRQVPRILAKDCKQLMLIAD